MNLDRTLPELTPQEKLRQQLLEVDFNGFLLRLLINFVEEHQLPDEKNELVQLAYRWIVPMGQREFRQNRLGKLLTQNRKGISQSADPTKHIRDQMKSSPTGEKHRADQGIYTVRRHQSSTAPIKLKRVSHPAASDDVAPEKRSKLDDFHQE